MRLYVNHSRSAPSNPETTPIISPETEHLLQLLKRWPRQRLSRWLLENGDIEDKLIARRVPEDLKRRPVSKMDSLRRRRIRYRCHRLYEQFISAVAKAYSRPPLLLFYRESIRACRKLALQLLALDAVPLTAV